MGNYWVKLRYRKDPHMILPQLAYKIISQQITSCFPFKNWLLVSLLFGYPIFGNEQRMIHRRWWWWCWRWWWRQWLLLWQVEEEEGGWLWSLLISGLEHFLCFYILGISSSQLTKSYFSGGYVQTTNQLFSHVLTMTSIPIDTWWCGYPKPSPRSSDHIAMSPPNIDHQQGPVVVQHLWYSWLTVSMAFSWEGDVNMF